MTEIASLGDIMRKMPSELHARRFLERLIWPSRRVCPHCGGMESAAIAGPSARPGLYQCRHRECRRQFTVTTCTPKAANAPLRERSPIALRREAAIAWFHAALLLEQGRSDPARTGLDEGLAAARAFSAFGMMAGAAILRAYERRDRSQARRRSRVLAFLSTAFECSSRR